jgi:N-methylhydantoinase B
VAIDTQQPTIYDESVYETPEFWPFRFKTWPRPDADWERIERNKAQLDPITIDVVEGALESAIEEAEAAVERTARSTIIREQHDYRASINTLDCDSVTHVSWGATADPIREHFPLEEIRPGDVFLYNDVYESHGTITHLPDYCIVIPTFADDRIVAFCQIFGHTSDVGGTVVGSWPITSTSIFEEGIQVPPVKLFDAGKRSDDIYKIVVRNSRFPDEMRGDVDSFVGASRLMDRRVRELCERLGTDLVEAAMYKLLDRCADAVRDEILPLIPNGEWIGEDFLDNDGITLDQPIRIQARMMKDPEKIVIDWTGTDLQTPGCINWPAGGRFLSKWLGGFLKAFKPGTLINEGVTRVMRNYIPGGTVMSPEYPASVANRMSLMFRNIGAYSVCMAKAFDGEVVADFNCVQLYGFFGEDDDGNTFLYREIFGGGSGARPLADGTDTVDLVPQSKNLPAEFIEQRFPVIVERVGLNPDSGGVGKYRGGLGYLKDVRVLRDGFILTNVERTGFGPFGVAGGGAGKPGGSWIEPDTPDEQHIQFSRESVPVKKGQVVRITTPGGGGWGDPLERDVEAVRVDVLRRLVSRESADRDYGVVFEEASEGLTTTYRVDEQATARRRDELRSERQSLPLIGRGEYAERMKAEGKIDFFDEVEPLAADA